MKLKHPTLKNLKNIQSSKGVYDIDALGFAEVDDDLALHLVSCGFAFADAPAAPVEPAKAPPSAPVTDAPPEPPPTPENAPESPPEASGEAPAKKTSKPFRK